MPRPSRLDLPLTLLLAVVTAIFLGKALLPGATLYAEVLTPLVLLRLGCLAKIFFLVVAVVLAARNSAAFGSGNPSGLAWKLLAGGFLGYLLGQAGFGWYQVLQGLSAPLPSIGDAFFLLGYVLIIAALAAFLRAYAASGFPLGSARERWLVGGAVTAVALGVGYLVLRPVLTTPAPAGEKWLNFAYPVLDLALLVPTLLLMRITLRFRGGKVWRVWLALLSGFLFGCVGDILFAYFSGLGQTHLEDLVDVMYILSFGLMARGALYQRELLKG